jgi:hypothetical protein
MAVLKNGFILGFILLFTLALVIVFLAPLPVVPALACYAINGSAPLRTGDFSSVPTPVLQDAQKLAQELYGHNQAQVDDVVSQLVAIYEAARDKDFVIMFNPGGWGWDPMEEIPGWETILRGIDDTLRSYGYRTLLIDYKRTAHSLNGTISELEVLMGLSSWKVEELALRVDFLTQHLPHIRVILTGESNGASICEDVVQRLKNNPQVYAIQTGPPFWHRSQPFERSLVVDNNGTQPDEFTHGDWIIIIRANLEAAFGIYRGSKGNVLLYIGAPGHDYSWDYEVVRGEMTRFLSQNFTPAGKN